MLRGLCIVNFFAEDHAAAAKWYSELFGVPPYYDSADYGKGPGYLEFRIGDYEHEFGILSSTFAPHPTGGSPSGAVVYWHVDDIEAALPAGAGTGRHGACTDHQARRRLHHRIRRRSIRQRARPDVQPALPRHPRQEDLTRLVRSIERDHRSRRSTP
jgi:predicted enzyme related to lactoylglutathione lyase